MQLSSPRRTLTVPTIEPIVLRDGSVATLRLAQASDRDAIHGFFGDLSPASRYTRFFTPGEPSDAVIDRFCDSRNPKRRTTLLATRTVTSQLRIVGVASYFRMNESTAEVAFAVDDRLHGKGIATAMLKRLAALAANSGFTQLWATTLSDNRAMMDVFRDSGFPIRSNLVGGCIDVVLSLTPSAERVRIH
jgi:acetate---CoA ligase (ADP-forming)